LNNLITIIGPTAIGKTALSIALAQHFGCDIISCDSRQFFAEMKIGTAVPIDAELAQANHHFIQNKSVFQDYSVGDYEREAIAKLDSLFMHNDIQIMVGGSGLYVDAVLKGLDRFPDTDPTVRELVRQNYEEQGLEYLQKQLHTLDSVYYLQTANENPQTLQNPQRMSRALEVCLSTGKPYSSFLNKEKKHRNFTPIIVGLEAERAVIYDRINSRVDVMVNEGLVDEARKLYPHKELNALQTVGYRELFQYFDGDINLDFAIEEIKKNTRRFAKRQMTWFKRTDNAMWFDYKTDTNTIIDKITAKI
jgi:tRNA dimethylallyltransferase